MTTEQFLKERNAEIIHLVSVRITTSGYDDRYCTHDTEYRLELDINGRPCKMKFDFEERLNTFLMQMSGGYHEGFDFGEQAKSIRAILKRSYSISGEVNPIKFVTLPLSGDDLKSIDSFLHLRIQGIRGNVYTDEYVKACQEHLKVHPLEGDLLAVVQNQIKNCDERNALRDSWCKAE
jgi:hypothetical protein